MRNLFLSFLAVFFGFLPSLIVGELSVLYGPEGSGATYTATLQTPWDIAVDFANNFYVSDSAANLVYMATASNAAFLSSFIGTGTAGSNLDSTSPTNTELNDPRGITTNSNGVLFVGDVQNHRVLATDGSHVYLIAEGGMNGVNPAFAPFTLAFDQNGVLYVADIHSDILRTIDMSNGLASPGSPTISHTYPAGSKPYSLSPYAATGQIYTALFGLSDIQDLAGGSLLQGLSVSPIHPSGVVAAFIYLFWTDAGSHKFWNGNSDITTFPLNHPRGLTIDPDYFLYFVDANHRVMKYVVNRRMLSEANNSTTSSIITASKEHLRKVEA